MDRLHPPPLPYVRIAPPEALRSSSTRGAVARAALAAAAGALLVPSFEHDALFALAWLALAAFFALAASARRRREGLVCGLAFGLAAFGSALAWLFDAVDRSSAPALAAALPALLIVVLALVPAAIGALIGGDVRHRIPRLLLLAPAAWTLADWLRHQSDLAFPWLALGASQVPFSPLAGFAPLGGVLLVGFATALFAALAATAIVDQQARRAAVLAASALLAVGALAGSAPWTQAGDRATRAAVAQTAFGAEAHDPGTLRAALSQHERLVRATDADVLLLPENALPLPAQWLTEYLQSLGRHAAQRGTDVVTGVYELANDRAQLHASAVSLGPSGLQVYRKRRLVPFGEFVPWPAVLGPLIAPVRRTQDLPPADILRGAHEQPLALLGGQRVAIALCYEDAFGDALRAEASSAGWLAVLANDRWLDAPAMARQHARHAQARALEFGRPLLRAANGGATGAIDHRGRWLERLPGGEPGVLEAEIIARTGTTPYARFGDRIALGLSLLALALGLPALAGHDRNGGTEP